MTAKTTVERFRAAIEQSDLAALEDLFSDDTRLYSLAKSKPLEDKQAILGLFGVLMRTFEDFRYVAQYTGTAAMSADGTEVPSEVLVFRGTVGGEEIHGIDQLHFGEDGRIKEFSVFVRPLSAAQALSKAVLAGLAEAGLVPAPAAE
ncbi:nuclear transport factor 2 family protein [Streptomyces sp. 5-8]|uniref:Nuclear transport factor 2 family protein n=1 Tax=Streptomyces musisoli TaxID=2802280 RepID=A0ABS1NWD1_9ACTN|nr:MULTISPECIES: nuclear transport factor 2 family protein [Streptomyces]MBL1104403.1 nuclear transport factor 2 family protein [Streptomyces musisoli]MBY8840376.1 nuclear transport factor 2 family protein [Streptomyces sp. SP2-10]